MFIGRFDEWLVTTGLESGLRWEWRVEGGRREWWFGCGTTLGRCWRVGRVASGEWEWEGRERGDGSGYGFEGILGLTGRRDFEMRTMRTLMRVVIKEKRAVAACSPRGVRAL